MNLSNYVYYIETLEKKQKMMLNILIDSIKAQKSLIDCCNKLTSHDKSQHKVWQKEVNQEIIKAIEYVTDETIEEVLNK